MEACEVMVNSKWLVVCSIILLICIIEVKAEQNFWTDTLIFPDTQIVRYHGYFQFEDTSVNGEGKHKPIDIKISPDIFALPYNLTYGNVDYCNFTVKNIQNTYDGLDLVNSTTSIFNYLHSGNFQYGSSNKTIYTLYDKDSLIIDVDCHYTDINSLYQENVLVGRFTAFFSAYQCSSCSDFTLEQLSNQIEQSDQITEKELTLYNKIQLTIDYNYNLWLILSWILKIGLVVASIMLIFAGVYWIYKYFQSIGGKIR
jgi:hypothetical protein